MAIHQTSRLHIVLLVGLCFAGGCGDSDSAPPAISGPFEIVNPVVIITRADGEPTATSRFAPGTELTFEGSFEVSDDREDAGLIYAELVTAGRPRHLAETFATLSKSGPRSFTFVGDIEIPSDARGEVILNCKIDHIDLIGGAQVVSRAFTIR